MIFRYKIFKSHLIDSTRGLTDSQQLGLQAVWQQFATTFGVL